MYEVYALKYGERDTTACQFFYREASHAPITLHYYVWLILGGPQPILVDTGFLDDDARERGIRNYVSPAAMVERAGVKPGALARLVTLNYANRVRIIEGDRQVVPGVRVHRVGGHTAGLQIVTVETQRGTVVLTSDASHFYHNVETRQPVQIITSLPEMLDAFETIDALAGKEKLVVAGHDPQVADRFKQVEPGIIKIA